MNIQERLNELNACSAAQEWAQGKTWEEIYASCHRGDWLLWLFKKTNPDDLRLLTLAKARCANTVRHLMKDERSIKAIDVAEQYGLGNASLDELRSAAADAADADDAAVYAAVYAAAADADDATVYAAADAAAAAAADDAVYADAYADAAAAADDAVYADAYADAKKKNQQLTADIVRQTIPIESYAI